jgi:hypothetical protein
VQGRRVNDIFHNVPSTYRRLPMDAVAERAAGKQAFEQRLLERLTCAAGRRRACSTACW